MKIWAHRGCSLRYPENTMLAFEKACSIKELTGIELDIQLTKDGQMVVFHDERVDRLTESFGFVRDLTLAELKRLHIFSGEHPSQQIPTMDEVFDLLEPRLKGGMKLNIELKNSIYRYAGMEEMIVDMVAKRGLEDSIVYSTFLASSINLLKEMGVKSELAILDSRASDCMYKAKGGCGATSLHPFWRHMDLTKEQLEGRTVRAWMSGYLFPEKPSGNRLNFDELEAKGITDIILNEPEAYLD